MTIVDLCNKLCEISNKPFKLCNTVKLITTKTNFKSLIKEARVLRKYTSNLSTYLDENGNAYLKIEETNFNIEIHQKITKKDNK